MKAVQDWRRTWSPEEPGAAKVQPEEELDNPIVLEGLKLLTLSVNLSTGLSHPSDEDHAKELLMGLAVAGEMFNAAAIRRWALRNGWSPRGADQLREVADKACHGVRMRIRSRIYRDGREYVEYLRERVAEQSHRPMALWSSTNVPEG